MVQPKEEILILTFCCSELPALALCEAAPWGCGGVPGARTGVRRYLLSLHLDTKATEGRDEKITRFQKLNSFTGKKPKTTQNPDIIIIIPLVCSVSHRK